MNTEQITCPEDVLGWIPWYPDGLEEAQRGAVEAHAAACSECREEIASLQGEVEPPIDVPDPERIYAQVLARMEAKAWVASGSAPGSAAQQLPLRRPPTGWQRIEPRRAIALAATLLLALLLGAVGGDWLTGGGNEEPVYETAGAVSAGDPPSDLLLDVVFREDATPPQINQALRSLDAQITSGPSQVGVYRLQLPADADATAAAQQLMGDQGGDRGVATFAGKSLGGP